MHIEVRADEDKPTKRRRRARVPKKLTVFLVLLSVIGVAMAVVRAVSNSENRGIVETRPLTPAESKPAVLTYKKLDAASFSFEYPSYYKVAAKNPAAKPAGLVDYWNLISSVQQNAPVSSTIGVTLKHLPGRLEDDTDYLRYKNNPGLYKLETKHYDGQPVIVATKEGSTPEVAALWRHNDDLLVVALTSSSGGSEFDETFAHLLGSLKWK